MEKQLVLLPKNAFEKGSRNSLTQLFKDAGYDKINGDWDRRDQIEQGDFVFRGVKGANALNSQLNIYPNTGFGIISGEDNLAEAFEQFKRTVNIETTIQKVLSLNLGQCTLNILAPESNPIQNINDLKGRTIFTKYPEILQSLLMKAGIFSQLNIVKTEGADTRVNEAVDAGNTNVAAWEVVGTGETARKNKLQIVREEIGEQILDNGLFKSEDVSTNFFVKDMQQLSSRSYEALQELGLGLESSRNENRYSSIAFNAKALDENNFKKFGMAGPTISPILSNNPNKQQMIALQIFVPANQTNKVVRELLEQGAQDLGINRDVKIDFNDGESEIIKNMPFLKS